MMRRPVAPEGRIVIDEGPGCFLGLMRPVILLASAAMFVGCATSAPIRPHAYGECLKTDGIHVHPTDSTGNRGPARAGRGMM